MRLRWLFHYHDSYFAVVQWKCWTPLRYQSSLGSLQARIFDYQKDRKIILFLNSFVRMICLLRFVLLQIKGLNCGKFNLRISCKSNRLLFWFLFHSNSFLYPLLLCFHFLGWLKFIQIHFKWEFQHFGFHFWIHSNES